MLTPGLKSSQLLQASHAGLDAGSTQELHGLRNGKAALDAELIEESEYDQVKSALLGAQVSSAQQAIGRADPWI